jgi:hypothetical protein
MKRNTPFHPFPIPHKALLLSDLLPYDPDEKGGNRLVDALKEYLSVLAAALEAMKCLQNGEFKSFDPLVGENACQIRAVKLALTISHCTFDVDRLLKALANSKTKTEEFLLHYLNVDKRTVILPCLGYLLKHEQLDVSILPEECFLIKSFLITRAKVVSTEGDLKPLVMNEKTDYKKIKEFGNIGSLFSKNIVNSLRKKLAENSVKFTQHISGVSFENSLYSHNGLDCIPCFPATKIVMDHAFKHKIPILLIAKQKARDRNYKTLDRVEIFFKPTQVRYETSDRDSVDLNQPILVLHGTTCRDHEHLPQRKHWIEALSNCCPRELVLAYAAAHRQYPNESKEYMFEEANDFDYEYYKAKAEEWGCSLKNPSLFFLAHAYCDNLKNLATHSLIS